MKRNAIIRAMAGKAGTQSTAMMRFTLLCAFLSFILPHYALADDRFHIRVEPASPFSPDPYASSARLPYQKVEPDGADLPISSGTGFFVSNQGYVITNQHVVEGCSTVMIRGAVERTAAQVVAADEEKDLALLKANTIPRRIARLRYNENSIQTGDDVMVIGYPREHGVTGRYAVRESQILKTHGPQNEPYWLQFRDSAMQGNSGGPLVDHGGNVVGVIVGKATVMKDAPGSESEVLMTSDLAISNHVLRDFLMENRVYFQNGYSGMQGYFSPKRVEEQARDYIVNIHCDRRTGHVAGIR